MLSHFSRVQLCVTPQTAATRLPRPWDSPGKNTGVGCYFLLQGMKVKRESEEKLKSLLTSVKEESEKSGLKLNIQKTKLMASSPITSWQTDGKYVKTMTDIILLVSKITADGGCSHEIKRRLLRGRKVMTNLDSILEAETLLCQRRSK